MGRFVDICQVDHVSSKNSSFAVKTDLCLVPDLKSPVFFSTIALESLEMYSME